MLGDGTFGFHLAEFDTAVRAGLPFVAVIGNDACWNAEHQIQLTDLRRASARTAASCCPRATTRPPPRSARTASTSRAAADLPAALERALASGRPACVNVMIERVPAPTVARGAKADRAGH